GRVVKTVFKSLGVLTLLVCAAQAGVAQRSLTKKQASLYLKHLPAVDKVELIALKRSDDGKENEVLSSKFMTGAEARKFAALWRTQSSGPDRSACHEPSYAARFYVKGKELFYASLCWGCSNILFFAPDFIGGLHFAGDSKRGQQLENFFQEAFAKTSQTKSLKSLSFISDKK
ncbi:MAG TPA: hypothetical protein VGC64_04135, partial [Pyrinomonadaceae bacterium]